MVTSSALQQALLFCYDSIFWKVERWGSILMIQLQSWKLGSTTKALVSTDELLSMLMVRTAPS